MDFKEKSKFKAGPVDGRMGGEREGTKKNRPDDEVWRCGVILNQQLMSKQSKPRALSSNNPRAAVPT